MKLIIAFSLFSLSTTLLANPYEPTIAWSKKEIRVCFGQEEHVSYVVPMHEEPEKFNKDRFLKYKQLIRSIVEQEFTAELGIRFTGWQDCPANPLLNHDLVVFRRGSKMGRASVGEKGIIIVTKTPNSKTISQRYEKANTSLLPFVLLNINKPVGNDIDFDNYFKTIALHEFGHVVGLRHAHERLADSKFDINCLNLASDHERENHSTLDLGSEDVLTSTRYSLPLYDMNSIMNYCFVNSICKYGLNHSARDPLSTKVVLTDPTIYQIKNPQKKNKTYQIRVSLSASDKEAIKCMYVYDEETQQRKCRYPRP